MLILPAICTAVIALRADESSNQGQDSKPHRVTTRNAMRHERKGEGIESRATLTGDKGRKGEMKGVMGKCEGKGDKIKRCDKTEKNKEEKC